MLDLSRIWEGGDSSEIVEIVKFVGFLKVFGVSWAVGAGFVEFVGYLEDLGRGGRKRGRIVLKLLNLLNVLDSSMFLCVSWADRGWIC